MSKTRRRFLEGLWRGLGGVAVAEFAVVAGTFAWPRPQEEKADPSRIVEAGAVADFTPDSVTPFPGGRFYLVRLSDGGFLALSSVCTHLGCTVPWNEDSKRFPCPCHASVFDMTGQVLSPPAPRALDLLPVQIEGGLVRVDTGTRIRRQVFEPSQVTYL